MAENGGIEAQNDFLAAIHATLASDQVLCDRSRLTVLAYFEAADVIAPSTPVVDIKAMRGLQPGRPGRSGPMFRFLGQRVLHDIDQLLGSGFRVHRPIVSIPVNGELADQWEAAHRDLVDHRTRPPVDVPASGGVSGSTLAKITSATALPSHRSESTVSCITRWLSCIGTPVSTDVLERTHSHGNESEDGHSY